MKKAFRLISAILMIFIVFNVLFTGCGNNASSMDDKAAASETAQAAASSPEKAQNSEPVKLKFTYWASPDEKKIYDAAAKKYADSTNGRVTIDSQCIPSDYDTKLTAMIAGNNAPDVAMMESATITFPLAEQGKLMNLKQFTDKDSSVNFDTLVPNITYWSDKDNLIGIAPGPEMFLLYYNKDMFQAAGVEPPPSKYSDAWTWDEFVEIAKKLTIDQSGKNATQEGFDPKKIKQYGVNGFTGWWGAWGNFIYGNGGDFVTKDGKFGLSQPEATEALQKIADLVNVHHVHPGPVQLKSMPGSDQALLTKKVAMVLDGQWSNLSIAMAKVNYGVGVLPKLKENTTTMVVCGMFSIFKSTKYADESWALIKALIDPESTMELNKGGAWMPSLKSYYTEPELIDKWATGTARPEGYKDAAIDMMLNHSITGPTFYVKNYNKIMDIANPALDKVWLGQQSAADAMKAIEEKAQAQVQGRRD